MEFLKEILGEELYQQFKTKIDAFNGDEANKDKIVKLANLSTGEYVSKGKYDNLQALLDGSKGDVQALTETIESLKKGKVDADILQAKVAEVEKLLAESQEREKELKVKYAIDVAMLAEGVKKENAELLAIALERKLKEKGEVLELDENDNIKGWDDKLSGLKTQFPTMFESANGDYEVLGDNRLPGGDNRKTIPTKEQFRNMTYEERVALKQSNEQLYKQLAK